MTQLSTPEASDLLTAMKEVTGGLTLVASESRLHTEILTRIVELLTPSEERSDPPIHELLAALIGRLDRQSDMLKEILDSQANLRRDLPFDVARAIDADCSAGNGPPTSAAGEAPPGHALNGQNGGHHP